MHKTNDTTIVMKNNLTIVNEYGAATLHLLSNTGHHPCKMLNPLYQELLPLPICWLPPMSF